MVQQLSAEGPPPHVVFELRAMEDREQSIANGHFVARDVEFVTITPPGGNLVVEREVDDLLREKYKGQYEAWRAGIDPPEIGTPLRNWPPATPAQIATLTAMHINTVEALAQLPATGISRFGIGGQSLKDKARAWLESAQDHGRIAEQVSALSTENDDLKTQLDECHKLIDELSTRLDALTNDAPKRRRARKDAA